MFWYIVDAAVKHFFFILTAEALKCMTIDFYYIMQEGNFQGATEGSISSQLRVFKVILSAFLLLFCGSRYGHLSSTHSANSCLQQCSLQCIYITASCILQVFKIMSFTYMQEQFVDMGQTAGKHYCRSFHTITPSMCFLHLQ